MKNKRGFTLTEILITIAIIGVIVLIAVPSINAISKAMKERSLEAKKNAILQAAELYAKDRQSEFRGYDKAQIDINTLIIEGYLVADVPYGTSGCTNPGGCIIDETNNTSMNDIPIVIKNNISITQAEFGELVNADVIFDGNGATLIGKTSVKCSFQEDESCAVTPPTIERIDWAKLGWDTNQNAKEPIIGIETPSITFEKADFEDEATKTYYAITSKDIEVTFNKNGATSISTPDGSCTLYNEQSSCSITSPTITRENGTTIGWNANKDATISEWSVGATKNISVDTTYYAITSKDITASFYYKGTKQDNLTTTKTIYNTDTVTNVEMPSSLPYVRGWSISENGTEPIYLGGAFVPITEDTKFYSVIQDKTLTAYFYINGADRITDKNNASNTCNSPGCVISVSCETTGDSCEINLPRIERNDGVNSSGAQYTAGEIGWFNASNIYDPTSTLFFEGEAESEKEITNGEEYYASSYIQGSITFTDEEKSETQELKIHNSNTAVVTVTPEIGSKPDYIALGWNINGQYIQGEKYLTIYKKDYGSTYHAEYKDNRQYVCQKTLYACESTDNCYDFVWNFDLYGASADFSNKWLGKDCRVAYHAVGGVQLDKLNKTEYNGDKDDAINTCKNVASSLLTSGVSNLELLRIFDKGEEVSYYDDMKFYYNEELEDSGDEPHCNLNRNNVNELINFYGACDSTPNFHCFSYNPNNLSIQKGKNYGATNWKDVVGSKTFYSLTSASLNNCDIFIKQCKDSVSVINYIEDSTSCSGKLVSEQEKTIYYNAVLNTTTTSIVDATKYSNSTSCLPGYSAIQYTP